MTISIPNKARTAFDGNMNDRSVIELPFPCPPFFVVNGEESMEELKNILYFGGFACTTEKLQTASEHWKDAPFPIPGFVKMNHKVKGAKIEVLAARSLVVSIIGVREYSSIEDSASGRKSRMPPYTKGARPGIQVLCVLGYRDEQKAIHPWGPVMLTAQGYQVNHIKDSIQSYRKAIKPFVKKLIPDATDSMLNLFWMYLGTFGEFQSVTVGAGNNSQSITPIKTFIPEDLDEHKVENMYVGEGMAEFMADLSEQSQEWLSVFTKMAATQKSNQPVVDTGYPEEPPPPDDYDSIPF